MAEGNWRTSVEHARRAANRLLDENQRITMNLFSLILSDEGSAAWTDERQFLICQSNPRTPAWAWFAPSADAGAETAGTEIFSGILRACPEAHINLTPGAARRALEAACRQAELVPVKKMAMNAYQCRQVLLPVCTGEAVVPTDADRPDMALLLETLAEDGEHQSIPPEAAQAFARAMVGSSRLLLWKDGGETCAMAMIAHQTPEAGRINTVVTRREKRGRGYAGMLVGTLCQKLLAEGVRPMLYADAAYPSSNRAYQKIGFTKTGEVTEYAFRRR